MIDSWIFEGGSNIGLFKRNFNKIVNKNVNKEVEESFQKWLNIKEITKNKIKLNNNQEIVILKVLPINFNLKSKLEQNAILNSYKLFLKNLNSEI